MTCNALRSCCRCFRFEEDHSEANADLGKLCYEGWGTRVDLDKAKERARPFVN